MAPSRQSVLVLLGLVASIRALPAPGPEADVAARQIGLNPPSYSMTWDLQRPAPTKSPVHEDPDPKDPEDPKDPMPESSKPSDVISLGPPSATISWANSLPEPTEDPEPEYPEDPEPQPPKPTDNISLGPPSFTISWETPLPTTTKKPAPPGWSHKPKPTKTTRRTSKPTAKPSVTATVSWGKRQDEEDPEFPDEPTEIPAPDLPDPSDEITLGPPTATITWGKREAEAQYHPTTKPKPTKPKPTKPKPTKPKPEPTTTSEEYEPTGAPSQPTDVITLLPPDSTITWGKRDDAEAPPPTFGLGKPTYTFVWPGLPKPTATITWGKREAEAEANAQTDSWGIVWPPNVPKPTFPAMPTNTLPGYISWAKRDAAPEPTAAPELVDMEARAAQFTCGSTITTSSVKPCPRIGCSPPCHSTPEEFELAPNPPYDPEDPDFRCPIVKTATNKCPTCACPTTLVPKPPPKPTKPTKPAPSACSTVTQIISPPCVPPICPHGAVACEPDKVVKRDVVVEKRVVEVETTLLPPTIIDPPKPTKPTGDKCTHAVTKTVALPCPTYTCVPWGDCDA